MSLYVGVDLSPSSSAVVAVSDDPSPSPVLSEHFREEDTKKLFPPRVAMARRAARYVSYPERQKPTLIALEDYDLGGRQYVGYQIAEVAALFKYHLIYIHKLPLVLVNPRKLKSYVKYVKQVDKADVMSWAADEGFAPPVKIRGGPGYDKRQREDLADAFVLSRMAQELKVYLEQQTPPRKGHIFLDPDYGLAYRRDLLFNVDPIGETLAATG